MTYSDEAKESNQAPHPLVQTGDHVEVLIAHTWHTGVVDGVIALRGENGLEGHWIVRLEHYGAVKAMVPYSQLGHNIKPWGMS